MRHPATHFALLGLVLWLGSRALEANPSALEFDTTSPATATHEELFFRHGLALGWASTDPIARRRLVQNMRFVSAPGAASEDELVRRALALGFDRSDPVVRRRLVQRVRLDIARAAREAAPTDAQLQALLDADPERFRTRERRSLTHVFVREAAPERLDAIARALANDVAPDSLGDVSLVARRFARRSESELALRLGVGFARRAFELEPGTWSGPIESTYGTHLVRIERAWPAHVPSLDRAKNAVRAAWLERRERELARTLALELRRANAGLDS